MSMPYISATNPLSFIPITLSVIIGIVHKVLSLVSVNKLGFNVHWNIFFYLKWKKVNVTQSCPILCDPMFYTPWFIPVRGILQARILVWVAFLFSRGFFSTQGSNPGLLHLLVDSLPAEPQGKPKNFPLKSSSFFTKYNQINTCL